MAPPLNSKRPPRPKRSPPPDQTHAEAYYYVKQMQSKTPITIVLKDDEEVTGVIEWYDRFCIKLNRVGEPNLMIYKDNIKYLFKADEDPVGDDDIEYEER